MATKANIVIEQGASFSTDIDITDAAGARVDLSNYTANSQIRKHFSSTNAAATFTCSTGGTNGTVTMALTYDVTANITDGRYVYDLTLLNTSSNTKIRAVEGIVTVSPRVTQ
jgi:hypothetical protein|tara:strand:+ start:4734 stop:5069 length:336 start_codon:yes stop_codon:yes gene_type:complete